MKNAYHFTSLYRALPQGYEDIPWCPPQNCLQYSNPRDFVGPRSMFVSCWNPKTKKYVQEVWTGSRTRVLPPKGWKKAKACPPKNNNEWPVEKKIKKFTS